MPYSEEAFQKLQRRERWYSRFYLFVVLASAVSMAILFSLYLNDRHAIQKQRYDVALRNCEDQNDRRANTLSKLNHIINHLPKKEQAMARQNSQDTVELINTLAPHRDCLKVAYQVVHPHSIPPTSIGG